jgi:hypothetical protein
MTPRITGRRELTLVSESAGENASVFPPPKLARAKLASASVGVLYRHRRTPDKTW